MELPALGHAFDRRHCAAFGVEAKHQTRENRTTINQNRAGSTLAQLTPMLGSGQREVFAQDFQQSLMRRERNLRWLAVERE